jgi:hypothetical protein
MYSKYVLKKNYKYNNKFQRNKIINFINIFIIKYIFREKGKQKISII